MGKQLLAEANTPKYQYDDEIHRHSGLELENSELIVVPSLSGSPITDPKLRKGGGSSPQKLQESVGNPRLSLSREGVMQSSNTEVKVATGELNLEPELL